MTTHPQVDSDLETMMRTVLAESVSVDEGSANVDLDRGLWATLEQLGLTGMVSVEGASWTDAVALLRIAAACYAPVPLAEHDLLAQRLRAAAGLDLKGGPSTVCLVHAPNDTPSVTWASQVDRVVVLSCLDGVVRVTDLEASSMSIEPARDLAGMPRDRLMLEGVDLDGPEVEIGLVGELRLRRALARSAQMSGAMQGAVEMSREYALQRHQFGRAIARFQAVQQLFVEAAAECALAAAAVDSAAAAVDQHGFGDERVQDAVAVAASVCSHAATVVSRNSHQLHGAIGTTLELPLHRLTRPLVTWRSELGGSRAWEQEIAGRLVEGSERAWFNASR
jgi:acyl-CoA dehydrogenase